MKFNEFQKQIEKNYMEKFNQSLIKCKIYRCLGKSITIDYAMAGNAGECADGSSEGMYPNQARGKIPVLQ